MFSLYVLMPGGVACIGIFAGLAKAQAVARSWLKANQSVKLVSAEGEIMPIPEEGNE